MPDYFFLAAREKTKYFSELNEQYRKSIKNKGNGIRKKAVGFKRRFEVKGFNESEECVAVRVERAVKEVCRSEEEKRVMGKGKGLIRLVKGKKSLKGM